MALLDVFGLLFESDVKDLEKGAVTAGDAVESIGENAQKADEQVGKFGTSFLELIDSAVVKYASLATVASVTAGVIAQAVRTDELGKFSEVLGLNVEDVDAWSQAVIRSGGDASAFRGTIESLTDRLTDFTLTGGGEAANVFARLGVTATNAGGKVKTAFEILPDLADSFANLTRAESLAFGRKLGLDQGTILLLQSGRAAVDDLVRRQRELGVVTKEDAELAAKFNSQWVDTKQVFSALALTLGTTLLPTFTSLLEGVQNITMFLTEHSDVVVGFFSAAAGIITVAYLPAILSAAAATLIAIAPFVLIGGAIVAVAAAFALLYEDILAFIRGEESLTGRILEDFPIVLELVNKLVLGFRLWLEATKQIFGFISTGIGKAVDTFKDLFGIVTKVLDKISMIKEIDLGKIGEKFTGLFDFFGNDDPDLSVAVASAQRSANANPLAALTAPALAQRGGNTRNTSINIGDVNVDARGGDSAEIAAGTRSALKRRNGTFS